MSKSKFVAKILFNQVFSRFIKEYIECFGDVATHCRDKFKPYVEYWSAQPDDRLFTLFADSFDVHVAITIRDEVYFTPEKEISESILSSVPEFYVHLTLLIAEYAATTTKDTLLKAHDDRLWLEKDIYLQCPILRQLQFREVFKQCELDGDEKSILWKWLNSCYLIVELFKLIPCTIIDAIDQVYNNYSSDQANTPIVDQVIVIDTLIQTIKTDLSNKQVLQLTEFFQRCLFGPYCPLYCILPQRYHQHLLLTLEYLQTPAGPEENACTQYQALAKHLIYSLPSFINEYHQQILAVLKLQ